MVYLYLQEKSVGTIFIDNCMIYIFCLIYFYHITYSLLKNAQLNPYLQILIMKHFFFADVVSKFHILFIIVFPTCIPIFISVRIIVSLPIFFELT